MSRVASWLKKHAALLAILAAGAALRFWGLGWGVPTPEIPHKPFHYDENTTIANLQQMNPAKGDFNPEWAHIEGTFIFYVWEASAALLKAVGALDVLPHDIKDYGDPNYGRTLIMGRVVMGLFDLATIVMVFLVARRIAGGRKSAGLWAALFYAILPFQAIHCHFMRPHVAGNLFVAAIVYQSLLILEREKLVKLCIGTGVVLGLGTATRYHLFSLAIIPYLAFLYRRFFIDRDPFDARKFFGVVANWRMILLGVCAFAAFFAGDPMLFLDFDAARAPLKSQANATDASAFALANLFNLEKPWTYVVNAFPTGTGLLFILFYLSIPYLLVRREHWGKVMPAMIFAGLYSFYATKGYGLFAIRVLLHVFPIVAVFAAVMVVEALERWKDRPRLLATAWALLGFCVPPTVLYGAAYVEAMGDRRSDPYIRLHEHFRRHVTPVAGRPLKVGFIGWEWDRYHLLTFDRLIRSAGHDLQLTGSRVEYLDPANRADYLIVFDFDSTMTARVAAALRELEESRRYRFVKTFRHPFSLGPLEYDYSRSPTDFRYPFPIIHLLAAEP